MVELPTLAFATSLEGFPLRGTGYSGILGLSFGTSATIPSSLGRSFLDNILASLDDEHRFIGIRLGNSDEDSAFTIGEYDPHVNSMDIRLSAAYPVSVDKEDRFVYDYYKVPLFSLLLDGIPISLSHSKVSSSPSPIAVFDTGTTLILGPKSDVHRFYETVRSTSIPIDDGAASKNSEEGGVRYQEEMWQIRCEKAVKVSFVLGQSGAFELDPADVAWNRGLPETKETPHGEDGWCVGGLQENDNVISGDWLLGDIFLRVRPYNHLCSKIWADLRACQNVYITHHAPTLLNNFQAMIGLANQTDYASALTRFRDARGADSFQSTPAHTETQWMSEQGRDVWSKSCSGDRLTWLTTSIAQPERSDHCPSMQRASRLHSRCRRLRFGPLTPGP